MIRPSTPCLRESGHSRVRVSSSSLWADFTLTVHINALYNENVSYIVKNNVHVELIRFRKNSDFIDFTNFELGIGPILSGPLFSLLSATSRHYSVLRRLSDVSGHDHFGTECRSKRQFGSLIRNSSLRL